VLAGWWQRAGAVILEALVIGIPLLIVEAVVGSH